MSSSVFLSSFPFSTRLIPVDGRILSKTAVSAIEIQVLGAASGWGGVTERGTDIDIILRTLSDERAQSHQPRI